MDTSDNNLLTNLKKSIEKNDKKSEKKNEFRFCEGAVKYNTIGDAYKAITENNTKVYIIETIKNGKTIETAYARCSKKAEDNDCVCHLHKRMRSTNPKGIKYFDKDILPYVNNNSDPNIKIRLANINDSYFDNMGKRGAKKKNKNTIYDFKNPKHPLLLILQHIIILAWNHQHTLPQNHVWPMPQRHGTTSRSGNGVHFTSGRLSILAAR